jgi:hypothetical protein
LALCKLPDGKLVVNHGQIAEIFVTSFSMVFVSATPPRSEPFQIFAGSVLKVNISRAGVSRLLNFLDYTFNMRLNGLHPCLLRHCSWELSLVCPIIPDF